MAKITTKKTTPATPSRRTFPLPLEGSFKVYLENFLSPKNARDYISYTKGIFRGYSNLQPSLNLLAPINLWSIIYHKDRDIILQIIFSTVSTNKLALSIKNTSQYFSGFTSYMDFISNFPSNIHSSLKKTCSGCNIITPALSHFLNIIQNNPTIYYSKNYLKNTNFPFRLKTQNRIAPNNQYYFPITLITKCEGRKKNKLGILPCTTNNNVTYNSVTDFFKKEVLNIRFLGSNGGTNLLEIPLKDIRILQITIQNSKVSFTTKNKTYDLYTEVDPTKPIPKGAIQYNTNNGVLKYAEPIKRKKLKDIVIDHDPEIALVMQAAANNNWLPRLRILTQEIDNAILSLCGPYNNLVNNKHKHLFLNGKISSNATDVKTQLKYVYDLWDYTNKFPQLDKLLMDIVYLHTQMTLTMMDTTINGHKNAVKKTHPTLNSPTQMFPNY